MTVVDDGGAPQAEQVLAGAGVPGAAAVSVPGAGERVSFARRAALITARSAGDGSTGGRRTTSGRPLALSLFSVVRAAQNRDKAAQL